MKEKINAALTSLSQKRPIFHSEADLQHALAWELREVDPSLDVRLEVPFHLNMKRCFMDMIIRAGDRILYVELKYKTRTAKHHHRGEVFDLKNQGANDQGSYDILKDIQRIEGVLDEVPNAEGFVVVISNDPRYWSPPPLRSNPGIDEEFRLTNNRTFSGTLRWHPSAGSGSIKGRELPIHLRGSYVSVWKDYATSPEHFRSLCFHVQNRSVSTDRSSILMPQSEDRDASSNLNCLAPYSRLPATVESPPEEKNTTKRKANWQLVLESVELLGGVASLDQIRAKFAADHPSRNVINIRHELVLMSVNHPKRIHYDRAQKPRRTDSNNPVDKLFHRPDGNYELYQPEKHGIWEIYLHTNGTPAIRLSAHAQAN